MFITPQISDAQSSIHRCRYSMVKLRCGQLAHKRAEKLSKQRAGDVTKRLRHMSKQSARDWWYYYNKQTKHKYYTQHEKSLSNSF